MNALNIALGEFGVEEVVGSGSNPRVLEYFKKVGASYVHDDETAWCAAFVGFCLETAGIHSTRALNARSYLKWGKTVSTPTLGNIVVLWRISPTSSFGHVGFFIKQDKDFVYMLGGNQSNKVCIEKYPKTQVLGFRG